MLGGEQSGHVIDLDLNTTGDGPMTAVRLLGIVVRGGTTLRALASSLRVYPQVLVNVRAGNKALVERDDGVLAAIARAERELAGDGRILVRSSGTEPLIRVMVEGKEHAATDRIAREVADAVRSAAARQSGHTAEG